MWLVCPGGGVSSSIGEARGEGPRPKSVLVLIPTALAVSPHAPPILSLLRIVALRQPVLCQGHQRGVLHGRVPRVQLLRRRFALGHPGGRCTYRTGNTAPLPDLSHPCLHIIHRTLALMQPCLAPLPQLASALVPALSSDLSSLDLHQLRMMHRHVLLPWAVKCPSELQAVWVLPICRYGGQMEVRRIYADLELLVLPS